MGSFFSREMHVLLWNENKMRTVIYMVVIGLGLIIIGCLLVFKGSGQ